MNDNASYALLCGLYVVGYVLYRLIKTKNSRKASDYGRNWMALVAWIATMAAFPKVIINPNPDTIFELIVLVTTFPLIAFVLGFVYGKFKVHKKSPSNKN